MIPSDLSQLGSGFYLHVARELRPRLERDAGPGWTNLGARKRNRERIFDSKLYVMGRQVFGSRQLIAAVRVQTAAGIQLVDLIRELRESVRVCKHPAEREWYRELAEKAEAKLAERNGA